MTGQLKSSPYSAVFFMGMPGCGKTTIAKKIADSGPGFKWVGGGALLRRFIDSASASNDRALASSVASSGKPLPLSLVRLLIVPEIQGVQKTVIFDGYPRSMKQYEFIPKLLEGTQCTSEDVLGIYLRVPQEIAAMRLTQRKQCSNCGNQTIISKKLCSYCGQSKFETRTDDNQTTSIQKRVERFQRHVPPLIERFRKDHHLLDIAAERPINSIVSDILRFLG